MSQGQFQAFLDPKDRPGGAVGGGAAISGVSSVANEFMMAAAVSEYRSKQQLAQNLATLAIKQDPGGATAIETEAQQQLMQHPHHHPQSVGPFQNMCFNESTGWDWNGYPHPNHNFHPLHHHHNHQNESSVGHADPLPGHLAPLPANSGGSSTNNNNNSSGNPSPQNIGGTDSPPVAAAVAAAPSASPAAPNLQHHHPIVPDLPQQPLQPEALLAGPPSHPHHPLYYDQQFQQYQYLMQQQDPFQYHHHQQYPIHHPQPPPPLEQYGFQDQPGHLGHHQQQLGGTAALSFPTPPTEAGDLNHSPTNSANSSSSSAAAAAAGTTLVKQEANVSPTGSCSGTKPKNWNNNGDATATS